MMTPMKPQTTQALELAAALRQDAKHHMEVAQSADMRPEETINWEHAQNAVKAADFIESIAASMDADLTKRWAKSQAHELMGIDEDTNPGGPGFDDVCKGTLSRVIGTLMQGPTPQNTKLEPSNKAGKKQ